MFHMNGNTLTPYFMEHPPSPLHKGEGEDE